MLQPAVEERQAVCDEHGNPSGPALPQPGSAPRPGEPQQETPGMQGISSQNNTGVAAAEQGPGRQQLAQTPGSDLGAGRSLPDAQVRFVWMFDQPQDVGHTPTYILLVLWQYFQISWC